MSIVQISRAASVDEIVAEMDRRGKVIERLEARLAHIDGIYPGAIDNLLHHQRQLDMDGIEVAVSRQALCEVLAGIDAVLAAAPSPSSEAVGWRPIELHIVFKDEGGPGNLRFVEVETIDRRSVRAGTWMKRDDGYDVLALSVHPSDLPSAPVSDGGEHGW